MNMTRWLLKVPDGVLLLVLSPTDHLLHVSGALPFRWSSCCCWLLHYCMLQITLRGLLWLNPASDNISSIHQVLAFSPAASSSIIMMQTVHREKRQDRTRRRTRNQESDHDDDAMIHDSHIQLKLINGVQEVQAKGERERERGTRIRAEHPISNTRDTKVLLSFFLLFFCSPEFDSLSHLLLPAPHTFGASDSQGSEQRAAICIKDDNHLHHYYRHHQEDHCDPSLCLPLAAVAQCATGTRRLFSPAFRRRLPDLTLTGSTCIIDASPSAVSNSKWTDIK